MKYTAIILLFFCSAVGYGQMIAPDSAHFDKPYLYSYYKNGGELGLLVAPDSPHGFKIICPLCDQVDALEKRVDFLTRDCIETHRRLDSLIAEWTIVPDYPAQWNYRDNVYRAGRNKGGVLLADSGAIKKPRK